MSAMQRVDSVLYTKRGGTSHANGTRTDSSECAVKQPLKSVVREIRTLRSVGAGGGQPPPATRWLAGNRRLYPEDSERREPV
jgi:hypothetical protein